MKEHLHWQRLCSLWEPNVGQVLLDEVGLPIGRVSESGAHEIVWVELPLPQPSQENVEFDVQLREQELLRV